MSLTAKGVGTFLAGAGVTITWKQILIDLTFWNALALAVFVVVFTIGVIQIHKESIKLKNKAVKKYKNFRKK